MNRIKTNPCTTRLPERKLNELQNEWGLTNTPKTNSYTLTYTPREILTTQNNTEEFHTKTITKTKKLLYTLFHSARDCKTTGDIVSTERTRAQ